MKCKERERAKYVRTLVWVSECVCVCITSLIIRLLYNYDLRFVLTLPLFNICMKIFKLLCSWTVLKLGILELLKNINIRLICKYLPNISVLCNLSCPYTKHKRWTVITFLFFPFIWIDIVILIKTLSSSWRNSR